MDQAQTPPAARPQMHRGKSRITSLLHNRKLVGGMVIGLVLLIALISGIIYQTNKPSDSTSNYDAQILASKKKYIVTSVNKEQATLTNSSGPKEIKNDKKTFVYMNLPPAEIPTGFEALQVNQEVDLLELEGNTIVYIIGDSGKQNISIDTIEATSNVPNRSIQISDSDALKTSIQKTEWNYNTQPPRNITIRLVSTPQDVVFIPGTSGNTVSTSAAVNGENAVVSLYINPTYAQTESPQLLNQFATAAVISQIFKAFDPTNANIESELNEVQGALAVQ